LNDVIDRCIIINYIINLSRLINNVLYLSAAVARVSRLNFYLTYCDKPDAWHRSYELTFFWGVEFLCCILA
jgi:hypothetical protein